MTAKQIIERAKAEIGVHEAPPNSNNVKYNTWYYGHPVSGPEYPWCAVFISWLFKAEQGLCPRTASCVNMLAWFEKKRQIVNKPQAGDIVFFKYNTNNRRTNHVGLVVSVSDDGRTINTIEGNTSISSQDNGGKVMQRNRYSNIVAYARPAYQQGTLTNITNHKPLEEIAAEVIAGKWGMGNDRRQRLTNAGYNYQEIQQLVNKILKNK
jgi:hypothetical protein